MECVLQEIAEGRWWCPECDPERCRLLSIQAHRNCGVATETIPKQKYLGDYMSQALGSVGITEERVSEWLGRPCGCKERGEKLNQLHRWTERTLKGLFGSNKEAEIDLEDILEQ